MRGAKVRTFVERMNGRWWCRQIARRFRACLCVKSCAGCIEQCARVCVCLRILHITIEYCHKASTQNMLPRIACSSRALVVGSSAWSVCSGGLCCMREHHACVQRTTAYIRAKLRQRLGVTMSRAQALRSHGLRAYRKLWATDINCFYLRRTVFARAQKS